MAEVENFLKITGLLGGLLLCIVLLIGCGSAENRASADNNTKSGEKMPYYGEVQSGNGRFQIKTEQMIARLGEMLVKEGYPKISDCEKATDSGQIEGIGEFEKLIYNLGEGLRLNLKSSVEDGKLFDIQYIVNTDTWTEESKKMYTMCLGLTIKTFDPDLYDSIVNDLGLTDSKTIVTKVKQGKNGDYTYIVKKGTLSLDIQAK